MTRNKQHGMHARRLAGMVGGLLALALVVVASTYGASRVHANAGPGGTTATTSETSSAVTPTPPGTTTTINGHQVKVIDDTSDNWTFNGQKPGPWVTEPNCVQPPDQSVRDHATFTPAELELYGMPTRARGEPFAHWAKIVRSMNNRICQYRALPPGMVHNTLSQQSPQRPADINPAGNAALGIYAGNIADEPCNTQKYPNCTASQEVQTSDGVSTYKYTEIDSDWYIPNIQGTQAVPGLSSAWLGIGGSTPHDQLVQAGSESDILPTAVGGVYLLHFYVWWEYAGTQAPAQQIFFAALGPGDHIWVRISNDSGNRNCYQVERLNSPGGYFSQCTGPGFDTHTAEAIVERQIGVAPLANYGSVTFQGVGITEQNLGYQPFWNLWHDYSHMTDCYGTELAHTNPIYYDPNDAPGDDFSIVWNNPGPNYNC